MRVLIPLLLLLVPAAAQDVLVIAPKAFHEAIGPWKKHREAQGRKVAVAEPGKDPRPVVQRVHKESEGKLKYVLLVGDVQHVPFHVFDAKIISKWERDPRVANDNRTADIDGDHLPDVAIGRMPADTPEEAAMMLGKVIAYENNRDFSAWRRRINIVASVGGFGAREDRAIEQAATMFLTRNVPASYDMHVTYAKPSSAFCPPPSKIMEVTLERFNEGALFVAYIGHGYTRGFDRCKYKGVSYRIFHEATAWELDARHGAPIAFLLCCSTGHFDGAPDCISETMLRQKKGPVAVVSASRVSMPYGNAPFAKEMLQALFMERTPTLGEVFRKAKVQTMNPDPRDDQRNQIEWLAGMAYEGNKDKRKEERIEHLYLYNLLGDPLMRLPHPEIAPMTAPDAAARGSTITLSVDSKVAGKYRVELVAPRTPRRGAAEGRHGRGVPEGLRQREQLGARECRGRDQGRPVRSEVETAGAPHRDEALHSGVDRGRGRRRHGDGAAEGAFALTVNFARSRKALPHKDLRQSGCGTGAAPGAGANRRRGSRTLLGRRPSMSISSAAPRMAIT